MAFEKATASPGRRARTVGRLGITSTFAVGALLVGGSVAPANAAAIATGALGCAAPDLASITAPAGKILRDPPIAETHLAAQQRDLRARVSALGAKPSVQTPIDVPVAFHVITKDDTPAGGNIPRSMIRAQINVLNHAFRSTGADVSPDSRRTPFRFHLVSVDRTQNADWFANADQKPQEKAMKSALKVGGYETLNIYTTNLIGVGLLGYAYLPYRPAGIKDGVVMETQSMPGGTAEMYNEGDTATHEVGHFLGLYHTFTRGCGNHGDFVPDTPYEAVPSFQCSDLGRDTCPQPGIDPIQNFMDYTEDSCMNQFSRGQRRQTVDAWYAYRAP